MANHNSFRTIKTPEGTVLHIFSTPGKKPVPHSLDGPAIKYAKGSNRKDEYFIYGIAYTRDKWLEAKEDTKVKFFAVDPRLED